MAKDITEIGTYIYLNRNISDVQKYLIKEELSDNELNLLFHTLLNKLNIEYFIRIFSYDCGKHYKAMFNKFIFNMRNNIKEEDKVHINLHLSFLLEFIKDKKELGKYENIKQEEKIWPDYFANYMKLNNYFPSNVGVQFMRALFVYIVRYYKSVNEEFDKHIIVRINKHLEESKFDSNCFVTLLVYTKYNPEYCLPAIINLIKKSYNIKFLLSIIEFNDYPDNIESYREMAKNRLKELGL